MRDPLLREILTQELLKFLAENPRPQPPLPVPGAVPAPAVGFEGPAGDGRRKVPWEHRPGGAEPWGRRKQSGKGKEGNKGGAGSQLSVSAKEARDLGGAGQGEESTGGAQAKARARATERARERERGRGRGRGRGGEAPAWRVAGPAGGDLAAVGEDSLRILMSARESFQRAVEERAQDPKRRGHVRATSLFAGEALETNLVRGITRAYSQAERVLLYCGGRGGGGRRLGRGGSWGGRGGGTAIWEAPGPGWGEEGGGVRAEDGADSGVR